VTAELERASGDAVRAARRALCALIRDSVEGGASIGFVLPVPDDVLEPYLARVAAEVDAGERIVVLARDAGRVVGMVQLDLVGWPNGRHRAEVQKLLVHSAARRQGLATRLMDEIEALARAAGRTLLVLDTITASGADPLYRGRGYRAAGEIPAYAGMPDGVLAPTTVFYKQLTEPG
jgi:ribosomal protein S18 acetylase RimI-like enzyme